MGNAHAAQGDSKLDGMGIETPMYRHLQNICHLATKLFQQLRKYLTFRSGRLPPSSLSMGRGETICAIPC
jgi:hypothetical protein